jgi:2,3-dihydroxybenzoate decarboxylase
MRYIALEEAFFIPELADVQPAHQRLMRLLKPEFSERYERRLPDFTETGWPRWTTPVSTSKSYR